MSGRLKTRSEELELLDVETPPRRELARVAAFLAFVNAWLGGTNAVVRRLKEMRRVVTVLDVGAGAADIPLALARRFPGVKPIAIDLSPAMLSLAEGLPRVRGDGRRLPFRDQSVDVVISTHLFHHLGDAEIVLALREFDRVARHGIIVNDLLRSRRAVLWIRLFSLWANRYTRFDGPISVKRGFTVLEIDALARRAGLYWLWTRVHFGHRFTLAGER
jgi:ubiquinone/menaquinone biosynthesis C-methylase UbiE